MREVGKTTFLQKLVNSKVFWLFFCSFFFAYPIWRSMNRVLPDSLEVLHSLPNYELVDQRGRDFGSKELAGKAYIANFFFTSCQTVCVELLDQVKKIQKRIRGLGDTVALVSFTVDPVNDTPAVLAKKAKDLQASTQIWKFLTGEKKELESLLIDGFKVPMGEREKIADDVWDVAHSSRLVLVNKNGGVLGYYTLDRKSVDQLMIDLGLLVNRDKLIFKKKQGA